MSSTEETVAPAPSGTSEPTSADVAVLQRRRDILGQVYSILAFFLLTMMTGLLRIDPHSLPNPRVQPGLTLIVRLSILILPTAVAMLLQLWLIWTVAKFKRELRSEAKWAAVTGSLWLVVAFGNILPPHAPVAIATAVDGINKIALTITLVLCGAMIARIIREPKILLPIGLIAAVIDLFGAMSKIGFTQHMVAQHPEVVSKVSVQLPTVHFSGGFVLPTGQLGPADILFLGFFLAVVFRHRMNYRATFVLLYCILTPVMIAVVYDRVPPIAALVPMGAAVIAANWKFFTYSREEKFAMLYASLIFVGLAMGFYWYTSKFVFQDDQRHRLPAAHRRAPD